MEMPSKKGSSFRWDEQQRSSEFSNYRELQKAKENPPSAELFRSEEIHVQKTQTSSAPKRKKEEYGLKALSMSGVSFTTLAATVAVTAVAILPPKETPATSPTLPPPITSETPVLSQFTVEGQEIGLDFFQANLLIENTDTLALTVTLEDLHGELMEQTPLTNDGALSFEGLLPENTYRFYVHDEEGVEYFSHSFTTQPFVTLTNFEDGTGARLTLHPSLSTTYDSAFHLLDAEGKDFSLNVYGEPLYGDGGGAWDSTDSSVLIEMDYSLSFNGLYEGEYTLQYISYLPEDTQLIYEKTLRLGDLAPLDFTPSLNAQTAEITLQYNAGDFGPYESFSVELYKNGAYYDSAAVTVLSGGSMTLPRFDVWESGAYTIYLIGADSQTLYNQIWMGEIVL